MATMITDPKAVYQLRQKLTTTVEGLNEQLRRTENAIEDVAKDWKDEQFKMFNEGFDKDKEQIIPLCKRIERFECEVLQRLQKIAEKYQGLGK